MNKGRVLIIDDEALIRRALSDYLSEHDYETEVAVDGLEGLNRAREDHFDAVLVDLRMPKVDGLEVISTLNAEQPDLPIIVVSGTGVLADAIEAVRLGAWDYITKPVRDMGEVVMVIERVLDKAHLIEERSRYQAQIEQLNRSLEAEVIRKTHELQAQNRQLERLLNQVREQATRVQQILDLVPEGVLLLDAEGRVLLTNPLAEQDLRVLAPLPAPEVAQPPSQYYRHTPLPTLGERPLTDLLTLPPHGLWHEIAAKGKQYQILARPIFSEATPSEWLVVIRDMTRQREIERRIQQQERLAAIGQLAAGIVHDFNNHLTAITGYSELLLLSIDPNDPRRADLEEIKKAAERSASLNRQLLTFSRKQVIQPRIISLNELIINIEKMLRRLIGEDIELVIHLDPNLGQIEADPTQIDQVIMNLVVNARDAMPNGGRLSIETSNVDMDENLALRHADLAPGAYVLLTVSDNGIGMDQETQSHLFEPFFTTKERGKGTGLGLATVYGIVKQSKGSIWVYSEVGRGSTFKIYLPRVDAPTVSLPDEQGDEQLPQGNETLLLVEDDTAVRGLVQRILRRSQYQVMVARNAQEAFDLAQTHPIDLLITDVILPQISGRELALRLTDLNPDLKVLFMSGYSDEVISHHGVLEPDVHFIQKPFTALSFLRKIRQVLDEPISQTQKG